MKQIHLLLLFFSLRFSYGQEVFTYTIPENYNAFDYEHHALNDQYGIIIINGNGKMPKVILYDSKLKVKLSEFNCSSCNLSFKGHSLTDNDIFIYVDGSWNTDKGSFFIRFNKKPGSFPFTSRFIVDENIGKKDNLMLAFSKNDFFYQAYHREKENSIVVFKIQSPEKINGEVFALDALDSKSLHEKSFKLIGQNNDFDLRELTGYNAYLVDDKITLVDQSSTMSKKRLSIIQLTTPIKKFEVSFDLAVDDFSGFILRDRLFVLQKESELFVGDELIFKVFNWQTGHVLSQYKFHSKSDSAGIETLHRSAVYRSVGDSIDSPWSAVDKKKKLHKVFDGNVYVGASTTTDGNFLVTLANQEVVTSPGVPSGPSVGGAPGPMVGGGTSATDNFTFFRVLINPSDSRVNQGSYPDYNSLYLEMIKYADSHKIKRPTLNFYGDACFLIQKKKQVLSVQRFLK